MTPKISWLTFEPAWQRFCESLRDIFDEEDTDKEEFWEVLRSCYCDDVADGFQEWLDEDDT